MRITLNELKKIILEEADKAKASWMSSTKPASTRRATPPPRKNRPEIKMSSVVGRQPSSAEHDDDVFSMKSVASKSKNESACIDCGTQIAEGEDVCSTCG